MTATTGTGAIIRKNYPISMGQTVYDETFSSISSNGTFVAPIHGFYRFELQVNIKK